VTKLELKTEKEIQLLGYLISSPGLATELFSKVPVELISKDFQIVFEEIKEQRNLDKISFLHILKKNNFPKLAEVLSIGSQYTGEGFLEKRIMEFYEITDSIKTENIFKDLLEMSKDSLTGLSLLTDSKELIEKELEKYNRFDKEITFSESIDAIIERMEKRNTKDDSIKTRNFPAFNKATTGLNEGNLIGIAGAFKNGKTTFALNIALDLASQNIPTAVFSLEMSLSEIQDKILAHKIEIKYEALRDPKQLSEIERANLNKALNKLKSKSERLFLFDRLFSLAEIESKIKYLAKWESVKVIMIDYIGLIKSVSKFKNVENRERELSQISQSLKIIAKENNVIIFILAQLNRTGIKDATSGNLAESLGLARDSDFLWTIRKLADENLGNYQKIKLNGKELATTLTENDFVVKLDSSRHTKGGNSFVVRLEESGKFNELMISYAETPQRQQTAKRNEPYNYFENQYQ
jgi:replicative DNA helicase